MSYRDDLLKIRARLEAEGIEPHVAKSSARIELAATPAAIVPKAKAVKAKAPKAKAKTVKAKSKKVVRRG